MHVRWASDRANGSTAGGRPCGRRLTGITKCVASTATVGIAGAHSSSRPCRAEAAWAVPVCKQQPHAPQIVFGPAAAAAAAACIWIPECTADTRAHLSTPAHPLGSAHPPSSRPCAHLRDHDGPLHALVAHALRQRLDGLDAHLRRGGGGAAGAHYRRAQWGWAWPPGMTVTWQVQGRQRLQCTACCQPHSRAAFTALL